MVDNMQLLRVKCVAAVAVVTLDSPPVNALSEALRHQVREAVAEALRKGPS